MVPKKGDRFLLQCIKRFACFLPEHQCDVKSIRLRPLIKQKDFVVESRDAWAQHFQFRAFMISLSACEKKNLFLNFLLLVTHSQEVFLPQTWLGTSGSCWKEPSLQRHMCWLCILLTSSSFALYLFTVDGRLQDYFCVLLFPRWTNLQANISPRLRYIRWLAREQPWSFKWCTTCSSMRCFVCHLPMRS